MEKLKAGEIEGGIKANEIHVEKLSLYGTFATDARKGEAVFYGGKYIREAAEHIMKRLNGEDEIMPVEYNANNGKFYIEFMGKMHEINGIPTVKDISAKKPMSVDVDHIIYNDPATIVFWKDGTKTVVKCMEGTEFNPYYGFVCALAKKVYGSNSLISRIVDKYMEE